MLNGQGFPVGNDTAVDSSPIIATLMQLIACQSDPRCSGILPTVPLLLTVIEAMVLDPQLIVFRQGFSLMNNRLMLLSEAISLSSGRLIVSERGQQLVSKHILPAMLPLLLPVMVRAGRSTEQQQPSSAAAAAAPAGPGPPEQRWQ